MLCDEAVKGFPSYAKLIYDDIEAGHTVHTVVGNRLNDWPQEFR